MYYKVVIDETSDDEEENQEEEIIRNNILFNQDVAKFKTFEEVIKFLKDRYYNYKFSNIHKIENKIFIDSSDGESRQIGFICNYWNKDISHNSKSWMQRDWIVITEVREDYLSEDKIKNLINGLKK